MKLILRALAVISIAGLAYLNKKDYDKAIADSSKAIEINPQIAIGYINRAIAYRATGKNDLADADEKKAKELGNK